MSPPQGNSSWPRKCNSATERGRHFFANIFSIGDIAPRGNLFFHYIFTMLKLLWIPGILRDDVFGSRVSKLACASSQ